MEALSFCPNWESHQQQQLSSEMLSYYYSTASEFQWQQQLLDEALCSFNNGGSTSSSCCFDQFADSFVDPYTQPPADELSLYGDGYYGNLLPYFSASPSDSLISLSPDIFPLEDQLESCRQLPKRQKSYHPNFQSNYCYGYVPPAPLIPDFFPGIPVPLPAPAPVIEFQAPDSTSAKTADDDQSSVVKKPNNGSSSLSVQSIAARERRRKITEKTQELGKLIPGGHRMNTAEMFQAASKYVKFLQAQVHLLQLMQPPSSEQPQEMTKGQEDDQLQNLLVSPIIQEKLYSEEKCLVAKEFVEALANDADVQSKPLIAQGIDQLLKTNGHS